MIKFCLIYVIPISCVIWSTFAVIECKRITAELSQLSFQQTETEKKRVASAAFHRDKTVIKKSGKTFMEMLK